MPDDLIAEEDQELLDNLAGVAARSFLGRSRSAVDYAKTRAHTEEPEDDLDPDDPDSGDQVGSSVHPPAPAAKPKTAGHVGMGSMRSMTFSETHAKEGTAFLPSAFGSGLNIASENELEDRDHVGQPLTSELLGSEPSQPMLPLLPHVQPGGPDTSTMTSAIARGIARRISNPSMLPPSMLSTKQEPRSSFRLVVQLNEAGQPTGVQFVEADSSEAGDESAGDGVKVGGSPKDTASADGATRRISLHSKRRSSELSVKEPGAAVGPTVEAAAPATTTTAKTPSKRVVSFRRSSGVDKDISKSDVSAPGGEDDEKTKKVLKVRPCVLVASLLISLRLFLPPPRHTQVANFG